jgi:hypothetical protein
MAAAERMGHVAHGGRMDGEMGEWGGGEPEAVSGKQWGLLLLLTFHF